MMTIEVLLSGTRCSSRAFFTILMPLSSPSLILVTAHGQQHGQGDRVGQAGMAESLTVSEGAPKEGPSGRLKDRHLCGWGRQLEKVSWGSEDSPVVGWHAQGFLGILAIQKPPNITRNPHTPHWVQAKPRCHARALNCPAWFVTCG